MSSRNDSLCITFGCPLRHYRSCIYSGGTQIWKWYIYVMEGLKNRGLREWPLAFRTGPHVTKSVWGLKITKKYFFKKRRIFSSGTGRKSGVFRSSQGQKWRVGECVFPYCPKMGVSPPSPNHTHPRCIFFCIAGLFVVVFFWRSNQHLHIIYRWLGTYDRTRTKKEKKNVSAEDWTQDLPRVKRMW